MTALDDAPGHWRRTTIGEIADVRLGRQRSPKNHSGDQMRPYLRAANVDWYGLRPDDIQEMNFTDSEMEAYALRENDILVVEGSGSASEVGKCALVSARFGGHAFQNTLIRVRVHGGVDPRWLMYRLNAEAALGGFLTLARGSGIFHLGSTRMATWPVAVPPLDEQRAIVDAIERMLSYLDSAVATVSAAGRRLHLLQAAVDSHATYGRLHNVKGNRNEALAVVAACRGGRNPKSILRAPLPEDLTLPETWVWSCIDELADVQAGAAKSKKLNQADGCVERPYLSVANVQRGHLSLDEMKSMWVRASKLGDLTLRPGDVLFNEGGDKDKLGRGWIWEGQIEGCIHQNHVFRVRLRGDGVDPRWLSYWGNVFGRWWFHARGSQTTGIASINKSVLRSLPVPVPPPEEQQAILEELDRRGTGIDQANRTIDTATQRAEALRRSILKSAFEGRLTAAAFAAPLLTDVEASA